MVENFRMWCQKVLPLVYDDSLSYYEVLCKVVAKLNEVIESVNENTQGYQDLVKKFNELKEYVDNYFDNLDVQEEINNKLDEMAKNGELSSLIYNSKSIYYNINVIFPRNYNRPYYLQGGTFLGNGKYVNAYVSDNEQPAKIEIVDVNDGSIIKTTENNVGHGNGCCYNKKDNKIIFLDGAKNDFYIFNGETLDFIEKVTVISEDYFNGVGYLSSKNNPTGKDLYVVSSWKKIYYLNTDFTILNVYDIPVGELWYNESNLQTLSVIGNTMCLISAFTNNIYMFTYPLNIVKTLTVDSYGSELYAYEIESMGGENLNEVYFASTSFPTSPPTPFIAKTSLLGDTSIGNNVERTPLHKYGFQQIYVDENNNNIKRNGTESNPFASVSEAQSYIVANSISSCVINLKSDITHSVYLLVNCILSGNGHAIDGGLVISNGGTTEARNIRVNSFTSYPGISDNNFSIGINCPNAILYDVTPETNEDVTRIIVSGNSVCSLHIVKVSDTTKYNNVVCYGSCMCYGYPPDITIKNDNVGIANIKSSQNIVVLPSIENTYPYISNAETTTYFTFKIKTENTDVGNFCCVKCCNYEQTYVFKRQSINGLVSVTIKLGEGKVNMTLNNDNEASNVTATLIEIRR